MSEVEVWKEPKRCGCGVTCWAYELREYDSCAGKLHKSEWAPGEYVHFCDRHDPDKAIVRRLDSEPGSP